MILLFPIGVGTIIAMGIIGLFLRAFTSNGRSLLPGRQRSINIRPFQVLNDTEALCICEGQTIHLSGVNTAPLIDGDAYHIKARPNGTYRFKGKDGYMHRVRSFSAS